MNLFGGGEKKDTSPNETKKLTDDILKKVKTRLTQTKYIIPTSIRKQRPQQIISQAELSKEQNLLNELFANPDNAVLMSGTGRNLPKLNRSITSGGGIIKSGDNERETAGLFGIRRRGFIE